MAKEYIEREAFREYAMEMTESTEIQFDMCYPYWQFSKAIKEMPAADVAPVVRCKDCQWFADNNDGSWLGCWLFQTIQIIPEDAPKPDDFCSYGEPKMQEVE